MHFFPMLITSHQDSSLTSVNSQSKDAHGKTLVLGKRNKGLGEICFWSFVRPIGKDPIANLELKGTPN